ncbi:MAG: DUF3604 domain-containing protein, partial [Acidimicrobiales bacterium]
MSASRRLLACECEGHDHRLESYASSDRRLLGLVQAFDERLIAALESGANLDRVLAALDPDPARYTSVDEGEGLVEEALAAAETELATAPLLAGFRLLPTGGLPTTMPAARPSVATAPDGRTLVAWVEWEKGVGETVLAVVLDPSGRPLGETKRLSGPPGDCIRPSAVFDGDGKGWVFFGLRRAGEVGIFCARQSGGDWAPAEIFSTTAHPSFNQEALCHPDGSIECCWQGYDSGRFRVYTRRQRGSGFGTTKLLSDAGEANVWDPAIAADETGRTCYAWTSYGPGGYETVLLLTEAGRKPARQILSQPEAYSLHPSLAFGADGSLFCAYDAVAIGGHGGSGPTRLRPRSDAGLPRSTGTRPDGRAVPGDLAPEVGAQVTVVRLHEIGPKAPALSTGEVGTGVHVSPSGLPHLARAGDGSMAIAYRCLRRLPLMLYFWDAVVEWHGPQGWGDLTTFAEADGPLEEPAIAPGERGAVVCFQQDGRKERALSWTEGFGGEECLARREHYGEAVWHSLHTGGRVRLGLVPPPRRDVEAQMSPGDNSPGSTHLMAASSTTSSAPEAVPRDSRPWAAWRRLAPVERHRTVVGDRSYELYWGDLHRHSLISRCTAGDEPELDDFYRYAYDVCEYDFWAVTDHAENTSDYQWSAIQKLADVLHVDGRFVPFYGFEWTSSTGHQNVIFESTARGAPIYSSTAEATSTPDRLWAHLRGAKQRSLTIPHHPGSAMVPFDWSYRDDEMLRLVEVFQACRGNYEDDGCFRQYSDGTLTGTFVADGLRAGHRFGLIASSDHGNGASYVGAYAEELSRPSVFEALWSRRTIAATTRDVVVDFRLNDCFMGTDAPPSTLARAAIEVHGYCDIARVELLRNGAVVHCLGPELPLAPGEIAVPLRVEWAAGETAYTDWSGYLVIDGGEVLETRFLSPEIVEVGPDRIAWSAHTRNFRSQYGAQRGGVELTLIGS